MHGGTTIKLSDPVNSGLPDMLILWPRGFCEFVEFKSFGTGVVSPLQKKYAEAIKGLGYVYSLINNKESFEKWITLRRERISDN